MALRENREFDWVFTILCGASLLFLLLPVARPIQTLRLLASYVLTPIPLEVHKGAEYMAQVPRNIIDLLETDEENRRLRRQVEDQRVRLARLESLEDENARLRDEMRLAPPRGWSGLWAGIVLRDPAAWNRWFMVDRGSQHGVTERHVVVGVEGDHVGLVGRVLEVGPRESKVLLLTDELSHVTAFVRGTRWEGLASGTGGRAVQVRYLAQEAQLNAGDEVLVSPVSSAFPEGLSIGTVSSILAPDPILTFQTVVVAPTVRQEQLKEVFLMAPKGDPS